jgi:hypothetical protein
MRHFKRRLNMEVIVMRELNKMELDFVSGGRGVCTPGNSIGGLGDPEGFGNYLIGVYEGLVAATSHMIERVANAF